MRNIIHLQYDEIKQAIEDYIRKIHPTMEVGFLFMNMDDSKSQITSADLMEVIIK